MRLRPKYLTTDPVAIQSNYLLVLVRMMAWYCLLGDLI